MSILQTIKSKLQKHHATGCGCHPGDSAKSATATVITKDMLVKDVTQRWPQTIGVFGNHKVDFCCGGAHSIAETARARGAADVDALIADLNRAIAGK